jgi:hypothetical protein
MLPMETMNPKIQNIHNASIIWKALVMSFPLLGNCLVLKVGNGDKFIIGVDTWVRCGEANKLPMDIMDTLQCQVIHNIG